MSSDQKQKGPTGALKVEVTVERGGVIEKLTCKTVWESLSRNQQKAALEISRAYELSTKDVGFTTSNWTGMPSSGRGSDLSDFHAMCIRGLNEWMDECRVEKIRHSLVIDVLVFGFSMRSVDQAIGAKTGTTRKTLVDGLSLYCKLRGWDPND